MIPPFTEALQITHAIRSFYKIADRRMPGMNNSTEELYRHNMGTAGVFDDRIAEVGGA